MEVGSAVLVIVATGARRVELRKGLAALARYLAASQLPQARTLLRLDGQYGTGAVLADLGGFAFVTRGKEYTVLDHPLVQARLHLPPDQFQQRPESQTVRSLYDCPQVPVGPESVPCRVVVATHQASKKKSPVGLTRAGIVYELFFTTLPQQVFTACDVVELYLHRGAFEPQLADEDQEIDPDRWCSHSAWGQECWQVVSQWVWNLRLELASVCRALEREHRWPSNFSKLKPLGFDRGDLDDAGLAFLRTLGRIVESERELPDVGQVVADSAGRQEVLTCNSKIIGTLYPLVRLHAGPAADAEDPVGASILLHLEEDAYPRIGLDVASRQGPLDRAEPDAAVRRDKVERVDARSLVARKGGDAGDHGPPQDVKYRRIVNVHLAPRGTFRNPRRPS